MNDYTLLDELTLGEVLNKSQIRDAGFDSTPEVANHECFIALEVQELFW
jgi:hypothetical protein